MIEKEEFCENVRMCEGAMYSLAYSIVKNDADAAEIISEAIYRAYKNIDKLKEKKSFKPWILQIVHNTAVEMIRKDAKLVSVDEVIEDACEGYENTVTTKVVLKEALQSLKQPYREVVVLFYYENLAVADIAKITGSNAIAVKKRLQRARKMLKEILREEFFYERF